MMLKERDSSRKKNESHRRGKKHDKNIWTQKEWLQGNGDIKAKRIKKHRRETNKKRSGEKQMQQQQFTVLNMGKRKNKKC